MKRSLASLLGNLSLAAGLLSLPLAWWSERRYRALKPLAGTPIMPQLPSLSIIVPARNEGHNLPALLASLTTLHYPGQLEIIVVDDQSEDDTAAIAQVYGVKLIQLRELPQGWLGKPHACHHGAAAASGQWLLFTDADTVHDPLGVATAVSYAQQHQLHGLTAFLHQRTHHWWDRAAILAAFVGLFAGMPTQDGLMNGQYILLHQEVYHTSGGFSAVRDAALEDLALGQRLHQLGYQVPILRGEMVASVRMYQDMGQMWRGLTRIGAGTLRWSGKQSWGAVLFTTLTALPLLFMPFGRCKALLGYLLAMMGFVAAARLQLRKYDPILRRHVVFRESR